MADSPSPQARLCGVRLQRPGPVLFVAAVGHDVAPSQVVVVDLASGECFAMVVFSPSQLVANEPGVGPAGRLLRAATHEEVIGFERALASQPGGVGEPPAAQTEWLVGLGDAPVVKLAVEDGEATAAALIERLFPSERREGS